MRRGGDPWPRLFLGVVLVASFIILGLLVTVVWLSFRDGTPGDPKAAWTLANYPTIYLDGFTWRVLATSSVRSR